MWITTQSLSKCTRVQRNYNFLVYYTYGIKNKASKLVSPLSSPCYIACTCVAKAFIPFAIPHDDTIINGIPLCPNLHRPFDRDLITIDKNYIVIVSQSFHEDEQAYSIKQYEGTQIALPNERKYFPP